VWILCCTIQAWKCSRQYDFYKPLPGVILLQPSNFYAQEAQLLASSLLGLCREDSELVVALPLSVPFQK
jgi:hypothetical protein